MRLFAIQAPTLILNIHLPHSLIWLVIVVLGSLIGALVLYFTARKKPVFTKKWPVVLALTRATWLFLIAFLLLSPFMQFVKKKTEKPILAYLVDNSASMQMAPDSSDVKNAITSFKNEEHSEYEKRMHYISSPENEFNGKSTNITEALTQIKNEYEGLNLAGVVVLSDGIQNKGIEPNYSKSLPNAPIFTVKTGDTSIPIDAFISAITHNDFAYLDNDFPIKVSVGATNMKEKTCELQIFEEGVLKQKRAITFKNNNDYQEHTFLFNADKSGVKKFQLKLSGLNDDLIQNNSKNTYIEVVDASKQILILAAGPHPDVGALHKSINRNKRNKATVYFLNKNQFEISDAELKKMHLVICHGLPTNSLHENVI
ncbi:MAG: hypothetical protein KDC92_00440, partial [Bacteroidetes bacterium]|nr:hypothetical protein [Bacteroidota bacterium]